MFANCQLGGLNLGAPDVCLTPAPPAPPVPVPYVNTSVPAAAANPYPKILIVGGPVHNLSTVTPVSSGDEAGTATGVASGSVMSKTSHVTGSFTCLMGGLPTTRMTSVSLQNGTNAPGTALAPSQPKVLVLAP